MSGYTVAIVGATGTLGECNGPRCALQLTFNVGSGVPVTTEFLTTFRSTFPTVRVLVRDTTSEKAKDLAAKGAELHKLDEANLGESFDKAFAGVDAIVNTQPHTVSDAVKQGLIDAVARSSAKVYFLSEFGV